ncbi:MAG: hypothetical protein HYZ53_24915 [Planctomycetes bacterium]|nr:hypothetical protein [Planctomycetota bacterium]
MDDLGRLSITLQVGAMKEIADVAPAGRRHRWTCRTPSDGILEVADCTVHTPGFERQTKTLLVAGRTPGRTIVTLWYDPPAHRHYDLRVLPATPPTSTAETASPEAALAELRRLCASFEQAVRGAPPVEARTREVAKLFQSALETATRLKRAGATPAGDDPDRKLGEMRRRLEELRCRQVEQLSPLHGSDIHEADPISIPELDRLRADQSREKLLVLGYLPEPADEPCPPR